MAGSRLSLSDRPERSLQRISDSGVSKKAESTIEGLLQEMVSFPDTSNSGLSRSSNTSTESRPAQPVKVSISSRMYVPPRLTVIDWESEIIFPCGSNHLYVQGGVEEEPVEKTSLLYVTNTENDIIMDINSQQHFLLLNGRWFRSKTLEDGGWMFTEPGELPEEFAKIPDSSAVASVLVSVPGTKEAQEAIYEQNMPQTAEIDRKTAKASVDCALASWLLALINASSPCTVIVW